jgi:thymidylate synthase
MLIHKVQNVCQALPLTVQCLLEHGEEEDSRAGRVIVAPCPVITVTTKPQQRVLFSSVRDANPFFHLYEAIWMLGGRSDGATLTQFVKRFVDYTEADGQVHDAYGRRWRSGFGFDQLEVIIDKLKKSPHDRQAVLTMWDPRSEYGDDLQGEWETRPCNSQAFVRIHEGCLDLTVCCRSNDMWMGGHGANAVHFSILQEYLAARIGVDVGIMYQLSNNCHIYTADVEMMKTRSQQEQDIVTSLTDDRYAQGITYVPMFTVPKEIDEDIDIFFVHFETDTLPAAHYINTWFYHVLGHAMLAHKAYKENNHKEALEYARQITADDWRTACVEWLERRCK